jgi:hypothetical protein
LLKKVPCYRGAARALEIGLELAQVVSASGGLEILAET